jgi:hypothetical protein
MSRWLCFYIEVAAAVGCEGSFAGKGAGQVRICMRGSCRGNAGRGGGKAPGCGVHVVVLSFLGIGRRWEGAVRLLQGRVHVHVYVDCLL